MNLDTFIQDRRPAWDRLEDILNRLQRYGFRRMQPEAMTEMAFLYRQAAADLAHLRTNDADAALQDRLNRIVTRAHSQIYRGRAGDRWSISRFFLVEYPQLFRAHARYMLASFLLCAVTYVLAYQAVQDDPMLVANIMGGQMDQEFFGTKEAKDITDRFIEGKKSMGGSLMSSMITTNNIRVALLAFALGITFGIGTVYVLVFNSAMVGGIAGAFARNGLEATLWATLLPHGALELSAIVIAGGTGMIMGWALWCPGQRTRRKALREESTKAVKLAVGLIPAFIVAGFIEGFITGATTLPQWSKVAIGLLAAGAYFAWVLLFGRGESESQPMAAPAG